MAFGRYKRVSVRISRPGHDWGFGRENPSRQTPRWADPRQIPIMRIVFQERSAS